MRILDLGCDTAENLDALPGEVRYVGYDMSPRYIAAAKRKFGERGTFHCRDTERRFMALAGAALKPVGRIYTVDPCFAPGQTPIVQFLISRKRGQDLRDANGYPCLAPGVAVEVTGTLVHSSWIPYTHWHMECQMPAARTPSHGNVVADPGTSR